MREHKSMKQLPESERPYEKFEKGGMSSLSDAELLAIIIKNGTKDYTSTEVACQILSGGQQNLLNLYSFSYEQFLQVPGIGKVKAIQLKAIAELSRRIACTERGYSLKMNMPSTISDYYMERLRHEMTEQMLVAFFDSKCFFLGDFCVSKGSVNNAYVSPREIFQKALQKNAVNLVLLHNHPSGDPTPSTEDKKMTCRILEAGRILGIAVIDHIIIGDNSYYSFKENNLI